MGYKRAEQVLPPEILAQIQNYVDGECIYIPRKEENRKAWGETTNTRRTLQKRDGEIYRAFCSGASKAQLAKQFYLSEKSIERILKKEKQNEKSHQK